jgi:porphobilinogen deaminase
MKLRNIGSRGSDLALWQSRTVLASLRAASPAAAWQTEITVIATRGDLDQSPLLVG